MKKWRCMSCGRTVKARKSNHPPMCPHNSVPMVLDTPKQGRPPAVFRNPKKGGR